MNLHVSSVRVNLSSRPVATEVSEFQVFLIYVQCFYSPSLKRRKLSKRSAVYWTLEPAATKTDEFSSGGFEETHSS